MARPRISPTPQLIERWRDEGLTHQQMADRWEREHHVKVSRGTISSTVSRYGLKVQPDHSDLLPWTVKSKHQRHYAAKMLRVYGRLNQYLPVSDDEWKRVRSWQARLDRRNEVVTYDPEIGFSYVPRDLLDDPQSLIRQPSLGVA